MEIGDRLVKDGFTPRTWHTHPLHLCPPEPYDPAHPGTRATLDWIFLISSLNFSFWSQYDGTECCYGVEWREGWGSEERVVHTGYWSLVAALDRGTINLFFVLLRSSSHRSSKFFTFTLLANTLIHPRGLDSASQPWKRAFRSQTPHSTRPRIAVRTA